MLWYQAMEYYNYDDKKGKTPQKSFSHPYSESGPGYADDSQSGLSGLVDYVLIHTRRTRGNIFV